MTLKVSAFVGNEVSASYDAVIVSVGYEQRSRFVAERMTDHCEHSVAFAFPDRRELAFAENLDWFGSHGFRVQDADDAQFGVALENLLLEVRQHRPDTALLRLLVDVSSMTRSRMARLCTVLSEVSGTVPVDVAFAYAPGRYPTKPAESVPIEICEPASPEFAGWSNEPDLPIAAIFGVGYEQDKVVGALEYLEPSLVYFFRAVGNDPSFERALDEANASLWPTVRPEMVMRYQLSRPFETFVRLESLTHGVLERYRPYIVPFGPKIFALCAFLVASIHRPRVAIWRVSAGVAERPTDIQATGEICGLRALFGGAGEKR